MKRESGANPGQTRCCEFLQDISGNPEPLSASRMGRHPEMERVRRPAKTRTFLGFRVIRPRNIESRCLTLFHGQTFLPVVSWGASESQ